MNNQLKGVLYASITGILYGLEYLAYSYILNTSDNGFDPLAGAFATFFGSATFAILILGYRKTFWKNAKKILLQYPKIFFGISVTIALGFFFLATAITLSSAGSTSLLERTQLLFIMAMGIFFLKEKLSLKEVLGIVIAIIGFILISTLPTDLSPLATFCILGGAFLYSLQSFWVKKYVDTVDGLSFAFLRAFGVALFLGIATLVFLPSFPTFPEFIFLGIAGFFGTFVSRYFYFEAHNYLPISFLNVFVLLEAVFVVGIEMVFFDFVEFSWPKIISGLIILVGLGILASTKK